jgi:peptide/nickel transport system permease protein
MMPGNVKIEIFSTDALIYLLVAVAVSFFFYVRRHEHLRAPWRQIIRRRLAMASLVILSAYIIIGLMDSIHYRLPVSDSGSTTTTQYSPEILSLLDYVVAPLRDGVEKTYSAPFAAHLFAKETIELPDGTSRRGYPRLVYGGAHLDNPATERIPDIMKTTALALFQGIVLDIVLIAMLIVWIARRCSQTFGRTACDIFRGRTAVPWAVILGTMSLVIILVVLAIELGSKYHILGTDKVGQDVFYQSLKSIRTGLVIGTLTTLVMLPFAILLGIMAGYFRGWVDDVIQYFYTTLSSIPGVLLIAAMILIVNVIIENHPERYTDVNQQANARLLFLCIILGITSWTSLCRLLRGESLKLREVDYIQAAKAFGVRNVKIITRHILPNVMHIVLITVVLDFSGLVLAEAVLSYVGVGVDPSMNSWGNMINGARLEMAREPAVWWSLMAAFVFMFTLVLSANLFSDAVRDAFDPRIRKL